MTEDTPLDTSAAKRQKTESSAIPERINGVTPIKPEYLIIRETRASAPSVTPASLDDDAEGAGVSQRAESSGQAGDIAKNRRERKAKRKETRGQNKGRRMVQSKDTVKFCDGINAQLVKYFGERDPNAPEDEDPQVQCAFGDSCRFEHNVATYLKSKTEDLPGVCPVYAAIGYCPSGLRCRWLHSHYIVREGRAMGELKVDKAKYDKAVKEDYEVNRVPAQTLNSLQRKKFEFPLSNQYIKYLDERIALNRKIFSKIVPPEAEEVKGQKEESKEPKDEAKEESKEPKEEAKEESKEEPKEESTKTESSEPPSDPTAEPVTTSSTESAVKTAVEDKRANYIEPPFKPAEKRRINMDRKYIVSPLTTVGNLPYRRLMKTLGADVTYGEMALALPIVMGQKSEWALARAHSSEIGKFGVQIAAAKHWQAIKAAEALSTLTAPGALQEVNLNCGCPIDLVYRSGAGSALMDNPSRLVRILEGMNAVSGDIPVTVKIRMGTKDERPTAIGLVPRLVKEGQVAAITIHGRSREQRYTKLADWGYIGEVAATVRQLREESADEMGGRYVKPWIIGNGDVYSWEDWYNAVECEDETKRVDSVMVARGALIKPWIFEEIEAKQHLDKSVSQRLDLLKTYAEFGLEHWGSDEYGVNMTRRYMCEFLSFTYRYVPVGLLAHLPPRINDRPPPWQGRDEMETMLGSSDYRDWIKLTEMYLGPAGEGFDFTPKHRSNAYSNNNTAVQSEDAING